MTSRDPHRNESVRLASPSPSGEPAGADIRLDALYVYPIKSCGAIRVKRARVAERGIQHDRRWMLVDPEGVFLSQRDHPRMALIRPRLTDRGLEVRAPDMEPLVIPTQEDSDASSAAFPSRERSARPRRPVRIWKDRCDAVDQGDEAARWFSAFLHLRCRLVRQVEDAHRPVPPDFDSGSGRTQVSFADAFPFLLTSMSSLRDLNHRIGAGAEGEAPAVPSGVPMSRFRPNLVVSGAPAWAEDRWRRLRMGALDFAVVKPCARCVVTTVDQATGATGEEGGEPLRTLGRFRRREGGVMFGQNLVHLGQGVIEEGVRVEVLDEVLETDAQPGRGERTHP